MGDRLRLVDGAGARDLDHRATALEVHAELDDTPAQVGWWTRSVTVAYEQHTGRRIPGQRSDGTFQLSVGRSTPLGMDERMARGVDLAADDEDVQGIVDADPTVGGTDRRITWRTMARDASSVVVTGEPKKNGTASIVATRMGAPALEGNGEARERWISIVERFLGRLSSGDPAACAPRLLATRFPPVRSLLAPGPSPDPRLGVPHSDRPRRKP